MIRSGEKVFTVEIYVNILLISLKKYVQVFYLLIYFRLELVRRLLKKRLKICQQFKYDYFCSAKVGRTGAGKSSLLMAIFRMIEATKGNITLSGVDIAKIPVNYLRSKMAMVPQVSQHIRFLAVYFHDILRF